MRTADLFILFGSHECEHSGDLTWCPCLQIQRGEKKGKEKASPGKKGSDPIINESHTTSLLEAC